MKTFISSLTLLAMTGLGSVLAQAETVILTISVNGAAEQYYKVQEFLEQIQATQEQAQERVASINEEGKTLEQEYQELVEQAGSDILTEQARNDAKEDARVKYQEIAQKQNELRQFAENVQRQLAARQNTQMSLFTKEIMEVVTEVAKERSASLVLDTSGASQNGMPTVYTFDDSMDITAEVVTRINASKSEEEPAAAAE
ncbi:OmpH family outer membrane protein [Candidatus Pelagisphaera phototrophica]|uniref:OmpH family outer membrane protein n=1 Tax=Candidatus Pelagisphaera phototrophica TaxID=2684113 RepID=UPI0024B65939|nr:OmpH family outer membrane protein [Candidatus Pelagisphaera phototrophica]QXD31676.1 OmpH family outer membrane protein [Candidatus Pelagisphaera phototrophica]